MSCLVAGCRRKHKARGLCDSHYEKWRRGRLNIVAETVRYRAPVPCNIDGCDRDAKTRGMCDGHYQRVLKHGDPQVHIPLRAMHKGVCIAPTCDRQSDCRGYCKVHYDRLRRHGDVMADVPIRPRKHSDDCVICEEAEWAAANFVPSSRIADAYRMTADGLARHLADHLPGLAEWCRRTEQVAS